MTSEFPLVELRQYLLRPDRRDELIRLFEREFVDSQEALGMHLFGLFRDLSRRDYFIWMRGFRNMQSRRQALEFFYGGPVWETHGPAANATMIDSDNVLLLHDARPGSSLPLTLTHVADPLFCTIFSFSGASECDKFAHEFLSEHPLRSADDHANVLAAFVTEASENTFPRLPVRQDGHHFVAFLSGILPQHLSAFPSQALQIMHLLPTSRSCLQTVRGSARKPSH